jgi:3-hydroxy-9,10-secoandrosta-1,3,5(10)-triene-9,17-dione monooxygenase reductase component
VTGPPAGEEGTGDADPAGPGGAADAADAADAAGPSVDEAQFRQVLGHFATGVTVVTAMEDGVPVGFTCQAFTALSLDPPLVALAPAKSSTSWPKIAKAGAFCVNILAEDQMELGRSFAVSGGDKFAAVKWHAGSTGAPVLEGALAHVECRLGIIHDAGDHELVTGTVERLGIGAGRPLIFYRGDFSRLEV